MPTLKKAADGLRSEGPVVFVIMDGVGLGPQDAGDAVHLARTPTLSALEKSGAFRSIVAHGRAVGLPSDADMGNSEVGHNALGAGRVFDQGAKLVNHAFETKAIFEAAAWQQVRRRCLGGGTLHLLGLLSDGNVHSHEHHLHALIEEANREGFEQVAVHILLDGRDVPETSASIYIDRLEALLASFGPGYRIASGGGRMVTTMDRYEADWSIVERGWRAHVHGQGRAFASAQQAVECFRGEDPGVIDQNLPPFVIERDGQPVGRIVDGDSVVFFNFRGDRAIEISKAFESDEFEAFDRGSRPDVFYAGMMLYDGDESIPGQYLVPAPQIERTVSEYLVGSGVTQYAISETQKYGHVTYFWNGNRSGKFDENLETYVEVPSDTTPFFDRPWMKAAEITEHVVQAVLSGRHRFIRLNFANGDMVGHTGHLDATVLAVETVDLCLRRIWDAVAKVRGTMLVTADHGNADDMFERGKDGVPKHRADGSIKARTSHTLAPVGLWLWRAGDRPLQFAPNVTAGLSSLAATSLELLGYVPPSDYDRSLITR